MAKRMKMLTLVFCMGTIVFILLYKAILAKLFLSLAITFGTCSYHFMMRLLVGFIFDSVMQNKADYRKQWYRMRPFEEKLYEKLQVKKWKNKMPTYQAEVFNPKFHTWEEIAQAMCQAELVHETIAVLSFLPIFAGIWFGAYPVFIITSVLAAGFDMLFVIMQRYNRQRILKLIKK